MIGRGLVSRLRGRLGGASAATVGMQFTPAHVEAWAELEEHVDAYLKKSGTSVVGSWEVATTELARVLYGREGEKLLIERFSDAVVPTLTAFQDLHKGCPTAMAEGGRAGGAQGTMAAATLPLVKLLTGLDGRVAAAWKKTADYLDPIFALTADPAAAKASFLAHDQALAAACASADALFRERLSRLPQAPTLYDGVSAAYDAWSLAICRDLEIALDKATRPLVAACRR